MLCLNIELLVVSNIDNSCNEVTAAMCYATLFPRLIQKKFLRGTVEDNPYVSAS